jgi:hypothetical protein
MIPKWKPWFFSLPDREVNDVVPSARSEPALWEILLMFAVVDAIHLLTICRVRNFWGVSLLWGDNAAYVQLADTIRHWSLSGEEITRFFWGFPYVIAAVSKLLAIQGLTALVLISVLSSLAVCVLVYRLYGGWVAAAVFSFINYRWIFISVEGGSETLFMCLLFASFVAARSERWPVAALLASLATTVRPVGVFALLAFATVLALRRSYRQLILITLTGLMIGVLYVAPLWALGGDPFANFSGYRGDWGQQGWPLTYPFGGIVRSFAPVYHSRWPNMVLSAAWILLALVGAVVMWLPRNRQRFSGTRRTEALFASLYVLFFLSYNYVSSDGVEGVAWEFNRFLIPVFPLLLFSLRDWIPKDRRVLWGAAALSALLASAAMVGFKNVFGFKLP